MDTMLGATCCFTGYRPEKLPWGADESDMRCVSLKRRLEDVCAALYASGIRHYICGMARGCDTYFCEAVFALREEHGDVTVEAAIPCEKQAEGWSRADKQRYYRLVSECDMETLISSQYTDDCMLKRNRYMVDNAGVVLAVFDGRAGGTSQTVAYAKKLDREIIALAP